MNVVVRDGRWKAIWNLEPKSVELYDLTSDPTEQIDVSRRETGRAESMRAFAQAQIEACGTRVGKREGADEKLLDDEALERLRSLGYID